MSFYALWDWIHDRQMLAADKRYDIQSRVELAEITQSSVEKSTVKKITKVPRKRKRKPTIQPVSDWIK